MEEPLKKNIKRQIVKAVSDPDIEVTTDYEHTCPPEFDGNATKNIVNRLGMECLQIEQSEKARKCYGIDIADAVADIIGPKLQV
jgi:hypothetical protein